MKRIIVALPSCGKTFACKRINQSTPFKAVDLDIKGDKYFKSPIVKDTRTKYVQAVFQDGCDVAFVHNGAINFEAFKGTDVTVDIVIRDCTAKQFARLIAQRGDSSVFITEAFNSFERWTNDMWRLFDQLNIIGLKTRIILLGLKSHIWDYLDEELNIALHCDC